MHWTLVEKLTCKSTNHVQSRSHDPDKGYFPHLFSTEKNQHYKGKIPDASYYDPDGMKPDKREEFFIWYRQHTAFDFQADLEKYCISEVDILQRCCGRFRALFLEQTNIEPFTSSITIASACKVH